MCSLRIKRLSADIQNMQSESENLVILHIPDTEEGESLMHTTTLLIHLSGW